MRPQNVTGFSRRLYDTYCSKIEVRSTLSAFEIAELLNPIPSKCHSCGAVLVIVRHGHDGIGPLVSLLFSFKVRFWVRYRALPPQVITLRNKIVHPYRSMVAIASRIMVSPHKASVWLSRHARRLHASYDRGLHPTVIVQALRD